MHKLSAFLFSRLITLLAFVGLGGVAMAAEITWTVRPNTTNDTDVNSEGRCVYAYTPSATETKVNGVQFGRYTEGTVGCFAGDAAFDDNAKFNRNVSANWLGNKDAWQAAGGSEAYANLLNVSWYRSISSKPVSTLTLSGLTVGKRYLVQIWICDSRNVTSGNYKTLTVGGVTGTCYGDGFGSNFIGRFIADSDTQELEFNYYWEAQFNAFQLRCLDEANMEWTSAWTSGESDIRTEGVLVYAYKPSASLTVAGTAFTGSTAYSITCYGDSSDPDIRYDNPTNSAVRKCLSARHDDFCYRDASVPDGAISYSEAYFRLIRSNYHGYYPDITLDSSWGHNYNRRTAVLRHLTPGKRYLVQLWLIDNRTAGRANCSVVVGNGAVLAHNNGVENGHGSYAVGTFTAVSTEQPISFYHRSGTEYMTTGEEHTRENYGPIQVRCLDDEGEDLWYVGDTGTDGSVDTRGQPLWAFAGIRTTVSDTPFTQFYKDGTGDFDELVLKKMAKW